MKKSLLILLLAGFSIVAMGAKPRPYILSGNKKIYCEKIIDGLFRMKIFMQNSNGPKIVDYSSIDAYYTEGTLYEKHTIEEANINEAFMEVVNSRESLSLVCYEDYSQMRVTSELVLNKPVKRLFLFDKDVFLCEIDPVVADELCEYFSE